VGVKTNSYDVIRWQTFQFCVVLIVRNCDDKFVWRLIVVYGSLYELTKLTFIDEMDEVLGSWQGATLLGGTLIWLDAREKKVME
jgi:hypothetical protein